MPKIKNLYYILLPVLLSFYSCNSLDDKAISTYTVGRGDFKNTLVIDGYTEPVRVTNVMCPPRVDAIVVYLVEDGTYVEEGEVVCRLEDSDLESDYEVVQTNLENAKAEFEKLKADLQMQYALLEAQVQNNEAEAFMAAYDSLQLVYATPNQKKIKELEMQKVAIEKGKYESKLAALEVIQQSDVRKKELEIKRLQARVDEFRDRMDQLEVRTTVSGLAIRPIYRITGKKLHEGDNVWNRMVLITIPDMKEMKIKIDAPENEYKFMSVGDSVYYTFDAMPDNMGFGKITVKPPVGQGIGGTKAKFFEVEASLDSVLHMPEPGFTAKCHIMLKELKDTIYVPQISIFEEDTIKAVYVRNRKGFEMRQVLTGMTSQKEAVITAGLQGGEEIALSKPRKNQVKDMVFLPDSVVNKTVVPEGDGEKPDSVNMPPEGMPLPEQMMMMVN